MSAGGPLLWLRWSWRDLRARWLQVVAVALVIGIGSGVYSGLSSTSEWRTQSYDASYEQLDMWDLRVELAEGTTVDAEQLVETVEEVEGVDHAEARLVVATQVDASTPAETILVPGQVIGVDVADGGPGLAGIHPVEGRGFEADDEDRDVAVLDEHFAAHYDLAPTGTLRLGGDVELDYVGRGLAPEHFVIIPPQGTVFGEAGYAVLWVPLATAQELAGLPGDANDLVLRVDPGRDLTEVATNIDEAINLELPGVGADLSTAAEDPVLRVLYDDIDADQRFNDIFAVIILAGAAFATFNLTGRIVAAQRREIGIGMALGVPTARLAVRPLLIGAQVAVLGVALGVVVGLVINSAFRGVLTDVFPMPVWITGLQPAVFARGALLGLAIPLAATVVPILRAVRVAPVDAIRTVHRRASGGLAPLLGRLALPGSTFVQLPLRNVLRSPRRTAVTALGIAAAITTFTGVMGVIDSYMATLDRGETEILGEEPDRLTIELEPTAEDSDTVETILDSPLLEQAETSLTLGGSLDPGGEDIEVYVGVTDLDSDLWRPTLDDGDREDVEDDGPGLVISRKAAEDLGVSVGDEVRLRHPVRDGLDYALVETDVAVAGIHPSPFRFMAFIDEAHTDLFDLDGITNTIQAVPAAGVEVAEVQRAFFDEPGVTSVQPARLQVETIRDRVQELLGIFGVVQVAVLVLALLIAFNSTSINMDERRREHATMFAFGLPTRAVLAMSVAESVVIGVLGTLVGIVAGRLLVGWLTQTLFAETLPDVGVVATIAPSTLLTAFGLGIVAVAVAPLLTLRRLRRIDVPSTLRVVE